ncbi:MAG: co-chaperone GroES [Bacillota bacterium]|jgi:chaperonin GroES
MKLQPLADRVLVKLVEQEEKTAGGVILPDTAKEKPQEAEVIAVGKGRTLNNGTTVTPEVKVGDRVLFAKYSGTEVKQDGEKYLILQESDILAIF